MTPDQIKQITDAIWHGNTVLFVIISGVVIYFRSYLSEMAKNKAQIENSKAIEYLKEQGKNIATKEDIGKITHEVESVRAVFTETNERLKADLASKGYYSQVRYDREMGVFKELWETLCELHDAVDSLRPIADRVLAEGETEDERLRKRYDKFVEKFRPFQDAIFKNKPFYPDAIWIKLRELRNVFNYEAVGSTMSEYTPKSEYWASAIKNKDEIQKRIDEICEAIRDRLKEFDQTK